MGVPPFTRTIYELPNCLAPESDVSSWNGWFRVRIKAEKPSLSQSISGRVPRTTTMAWEGIPFKGNQKTKPFKGKTKIQTPGREPSPHRKDFGASARRKPRGVSLCSGADEGLQRRRPRRHLAGLLLRKPSNRTWAEATRRGNPNQATSQWPASPVSACMFLASQCCFANHNWSQLSNHSRFPYRDSGLLRAVRMRTQNMCIYVYINNACPHFLSGLAKANPN